MDDLLRRILTDGAIIAVLFGLLTLLIKKWISEAIAHHFQSSLEKTKSSLELEKQKGHILLERRIGIYPEMLELVYRLRNQLRSCLEVLEMQYLEAQGSEIEKPVAPIEPSVPPLGEELYLLTENLYKYRAFIDEESFQMLHRYKRLLQDAQVLFNRLDRPPNNVSEIIKELKKPTSDNREDFEPRIADAFRKSRNHFITCYEESIENLKMIYHEIDELYPRITTRIKKHIGTFLER